MKTIEELQSYRAKLRCSLKEIDNIFEDCMREALSVLDAQGIDKYLESATSIGNLGRGTELVLIFLETAPAIARIVGQEILGEIAWMGQMLSQSANGKAINPFLSTLPAASRRLETAKLLREYFLLVERMALEGKEGLIPMLNQIDVILTQVSIGGLKHWIEYGLRVYRGQAHRLGDYFSLQSADSRAALQRERHGTLYVDSERRLDMYLRAFWELETQCHPYSLAFSGMRRPMPHLDSQGFHLPDVYDDLDGIRGIDRYRALLSHMAAHLLYTRPYLADNYSPFQHMFIEVFEDARVERLAIQRFPGLHKLWLRLHPVPQQDACPEGWSPVRHELAMLSRALLDPDHSYTQTLLLEFVQRFNERITQDPHDSKISTDLGVEYLLKIHTPDFRRPKIWFKDTEVSYRDDNRYLWIFLEDTDKEDEFHSDHAAANPRQLEGEDAALFCFHHPEWDYQQNNYRPDWVTVYESMHPDASAADIDKLLEKNKVLAKKLKRIVDLLKPQQHVRVRFQEDGDELDLDVALRAMVDFKTGTTPDQRIHMSHRTDGRDIAVTLLLDLSESINEVPAGCEQTVLDLSQEAVSLLAWAIDELGDSLAIAGFASNTRHEVRYLHIKGFNEPWDSQVKARLAAMQGGYSTRMGAAIRHAGHYLGKRSNAKKLLFILTDGEPADIDVHDPQHLHADAKKAVEELQSQGIMTYCISLDPSADEYVSNIFGRSYTVIDHVAKLPEQLPRLFMSLTK